MHFILFYRWMSYSQLIWSSKQWSYVASESQHRGLWLVKLFMLVVVFCFYMGKMFLLHAMVLIWCQSYRHQGAWSNDPRQATPWRWESWQSSKQKRRLFANLEKLHVTATEIPRGVLLPISPKAKLFDFVWFCKLSVSFQWILFVVYIHKNRFLLLALSYPN